MTLYSLVAQTVKRLAYNEGDLGLIPGSGRSSGEGNGNPLQYSYLENFRARGAWWATVYQVVKRHSSIELSCVRVFVPPWTIAARLLCPWNSPGKNTGVGCHSLLQKIFPTQESNLGVLHSRQILYYQSYKENSGR